jgi:hypothetical protein
MKNTVIALGLAAIVPFAASAADGRLSYNYVEGGYVATDSKGGDADGFGIKGSLAVHPNYHVFADYTGQETDLGKVDVDQWRIGAGYNRGISQNTDLVARAAYQKFDPQYGYDFNGVSAEVACVRSCTRWWKAMPSPVMRITARSTASTRTASSMAASVRWPTSTPTGA